jgi:hypothetical protein
MVIPTYFWRCRGARLSRRGLDQVVLERAERTAGQVVGELADRVGEGADGLVPPVDEVVPLLLDLDHEPEPAGQRAVDAVQDRQDRLPAVLVGRVE